MENDARLTVGTAAKVGLGIAILAAASGAAFGAWIENGAGIFRAMVDAGLAWCM